MIANPGISIKHKKFKLKLIKMSHKNVSQSSPTKEKIMGIEQIANDFQGGIKITKYQTKTIHH